MTIEKKVDGTQMELLIEGRLDTTTSPQLEAELKRSIGGVEALLIDMADLAYVSSAGLRVLLSAQKVMNRQGSMTIRKVSPEIMEIFEVTGFVDILNIEE